MLKRTFHLKLYKILIFVIFSVLSTQALASLTFTADSIAGTSASTIDLGPGNALLLQTINNGNIITGSGKLGIGTASPLLKLDVAGSGRFTGSSTSVLTGTIDPTASTAVVGVGTFFTTELAVGDRITVSGETKTVTAITDNTNLTVDSAFTDNANDTSVDKLAAIFIARDSSNNVKMVMNDLGHVVVGASSLDDPTNTFFEISGQNADRPLLFVTGYSTSGGVTGRGAGGTPSVPTATASGSNFTIFTGRPYTGTGFAGNMAAIFFQAAENITPTAQGTRITFLTTLNGTSSRPERMRIENNGNVGIGTASPNANAILDVSSTTKAFMPPRMTTAQRDAIASPTAGMIIYNTTLNKLNVYTTAWEIVTSL